MKKILLGTTALATAMFMVKPAEADPITVTLGGTFQYNFGIVDEDRDTGKRGTASETDTEVYVGAHGKTESGLKYGAKIQLQGDQSDVKNSDETYLYLSGDWGRLEVGDQDGASERMSYHTPYAFGTGGVQGDYSNFVYRNNGDANTDTFNAFTQGAGTTAVLSGGEFSVDGRKFIAGLNHMTKAFDSDDATKITYFSPRFEGFQFGVSYAPDGEGSLGRDKNHTGAADERVQGLAKLSDFENIYEVGLNYVNEFDGIGVAVSATYTGADAKGSTGGAYEFEDLASYQVGGQVSYMGFTLGGGYVNSGDSGYNTSRRNNDDAQAFNVGIQYETGPFAVGVNALFAENEGFQGTTRNNHLDVVSVGASYYLAPGLATYVEGTYFDYKSSEKSAANAKVNDNDGTVVIIGTMFEF